MVRVRISVIGPPLTVVGGRMCTVLPPSIDRGPIPGPIGLDVTGALMVGHRGPLPVSRVAGHDEVGTGKCCIFLGRYV